MAVVVTLIYPPIPIRDFDYCAYEQEQEEFGPYGYGAAADAAIKDLEENYDI